MKIQANPKKLTKREKQAEARLAAVVLLHIVDPDDPLEHCQHCQFPMPCPTLRAAEGKP